MIANTKQILDNPIAVIGAGTLGRRIALMFATRGNDVRIYSRSSTSREEAVRFVAERLPQLLKSIPDGKSGSVVASASLDSAIRDAGLVVETVSEDLRLKKDIFAELDRAAPPSAILVSNSSSFPTSKMIDGVHAPERVANMHFYLPPEMNPVEVMSCFGGKPISATALYVKRGYGFNRLSSATAERD